MHALRCRSHHGLTLPLPLPPPLPLTSYYGLTAAGYRIPFKPLMTIMQLFQ